MIEKAEKNVCDIVTVAKQIYPLAHRGIVLKGLNPFACEVFQHPADHCSYLTRIKGYL